VIVGGPVNTCVIMSYLLVQYSPYTFTVALLDTTDPASLLTLHLYMHCPTAMFLLVVYDWLLALLIDVQLLPDLLSQEYISVPRPLPLHVRVVVLCIGTITFLGCVVIVGGPVLTTVSYNTYYCSTCYFHHYSYCVTCVS